MMAISSERLVSTAIVAFSERYTECLATQRAKARLSRTLTWTFVVPRKDGRYRRPNIDFTPPQPNSMITHQIDCALRPGVSPVPFVGE
jgi:hypothetical protein